MSKKNMNAMAPNEAPAVANNPEHPANKKNVGYRMLALLVLILSVAAFFVPMLKGLSADYAETSGTLVSAITGSFSSGNALFGVLPILTPDTALGGVYGLGIYLFVIGLVVAAIISLFAIFSKAKAPSRARKALFFLVFGSFAYAYSLMVVSTSVSGKAVYDIISIAIAAIGVLFYFILAAIQVKKAVWINVLQGLITVVYSVLLALAVAKDNLLSLNLKAISLIAVIWMFVTTLISMVRLTAEKGWVKDLVRHIISLIMALVVCYVMFAEKDGLSNPQYVLAILAALLTIVQIVIVVILIRKANKKEVEEAKEEAVQGFHTEEYAEAYAYEGGPVAGVLMAEEINPSFLPHEPHVNTAGYDFYNCKSFDPFIATLNTAERNAFTELFILRFSGTLPEIPNYVVGGDNKEFFRKIFIYLGQYRDRIPSDLLGKMYQFSIKMI